MPIYECPDCGRVFESETALLFCCAESGPLAIGGFRHDDLQGQRL